MIDTDELVAKLRADPGAIVIMHPDTPTLVQTYFMLNFPDQFKISRNMERGVIGLLPTITLDTLLAEVLGRSSELISERLAKVMTEVHCKYGAEVMVRGKKTLIRVRSEHAGEMHCLFHREDIRHDAVADQGNGYQVWQVWRYPSTHTDPDCAAVCSIQARLENRLAVTGLSND